MVLQRLGMWRIYVTHIQDTIIYGTYSFHMAQKSKMGLQTTCKTLSSALQSPFVRGWNLNFTCFHLPAGTSQWIHFRSFV